MKKEFKKISEFENEDQEREFWANRDSAEFFDWSKAERVVFPELRPTTKTISLRLPGHLLDDLKLLAHKLDIPYQSLIKLFLKERIDKELG